MRGRAARRLLGHPWVARPLMVVAAAAMPLAAAEGALRIFWPIHAVSNPWK